MYEILVTFVMLVVAYFIGTYLEKKHYRLIFAREKVLNSIPAVASRYPPEGQYDQQLVLGSVTVSVDYFKRFLAALHNFFGGKVTSYESLLDRARREAVLRMKASAKECNAEMVMNIKYETASIYKGRGRSVGSVEVLAYGTAMIPVKAVSQ